MSYSTDTIANIIDQVNQGLFLPAIQRPYVWETDQIVSLFDSLMKSYPISSFLFWAIDRENRDNWDIYRFIDRFKQGDVHNAPASVEGHHQVTLVLDGQQRLTSLLIALRGSYTVRAKYKRKSNPDAWSEQHFYLDLMKAPDEDKAGEDMEIGVSYGFAFSEHTLRDSSEHHWFKVARILDYPNQSSLDVLIDEIDARLPREASRFERRTVERNLRRLHQVIWSEQTIAYYTEKDQAYDRVLDIFIRANDGGTKLSKSDLLMSLVTLSWKGMNGRDEIFGLVDRLNDELVRKNSLTRDFVLKAALVLCDLDVQYMATNFTNRNLEIIQEQWPAIKRSLEATMRLVNSFGLDSETLTSLNALMPIAYYLHKRGISLDGSTPSEARNRAAIHKFLLGVLVNSAFSGTSDSAIQTARGTLRDSLRLHEDFPARQLSDALARRGRLATFDRQNVSSLFDITYKKRTAFLALSLIYDRNDWGSGTFHIDHIIPRALASRRALMGMNIPESRIQEILEAVDGIGNLQILLGRENLEKSAQSFEQWIMTRDSDFLDRHLIPDDPDLWSVERLPEFVREREKLIERRLLSTHLREISTEADEQSVGA